MSNLNNCIKANFEANLTPDQGLVTDSVVRSLEEKEDGNLDSLRNWEI